LNYFRGLKSWQVYFVMSNCEVWPSDFTAVMNVKFACCYFSSYYSASDIVFFSVVFAIFQFFRPVNYESFECLKRQEFEQRLIVFYTNTLFQWIEQDLLREFTLVLELNLNFR
jgi:hypothetical protein